MRVLMHSVVWQYVPADQQARVTAAMETAGARATAERPLAWIALEANRTMHRHEMIVRHWPGGGEPARSEEHTSEIQSLMRISYAVFCLKKKKTRNTQQIRSTEKR